MQYLQPWASISIEWEITNFTIFGLSQEKSPSAQPGKNPSDAHVCSNRTDCHDLLFVKFATNREMLFKTTDIFKTCCGKFPFSSKLLRSVRALSVDLVSALSTRRFTWLLSFVCVLAVCGCQSVSEWLRMEACILRFNRRRRSDLVFAIRKVASQNPVTAYEPAAYGQRQSSHMQQEHHCRQPRQSDLLNQF